MSKTYRNSQGLLVKIFEAEEFVDCDGRGKTFAASLYRYWKKKGQIKEWEINYVEPGQKKYCDSNVITKDGRKINIEIHVKRFWKEDNRFDLADFHFETRKEKTEYSDVNGHLMFSYDGKSAIYVKRETYLKSPTTPKKCRTGLEIFHEIAREEAVAIYHRVDGDIWKKEAR